MKKLSLILAVLMLAALCAMPTSAAAAKTLVGTPELDGEIDEIYYQSGSFTMTTDNQVHKGGAEYTDCPEFKATSYFLWDDEYVYIATEVTDATIMATTKGDPAAAYVWQNDVVEHWISVDGGATWGQFNLDAHNKGIGIGAANATADKAKVDGAAQIIDDETYVVEVKFPHGGSDKVCVSMQINNIMAEDGSKIICIGKQKGPEYALELSDEEAVVEVIEEVEEEAPATSAATADVVTLAVAALVLSGAGVVVSKKNRK